MYLTNKGDPNIYYHSRVDLGLLAMYGFSPLPIFPELESHHKVQFSVILSKPLFFGGGSYPSARDNVSVFYGLANRVGFQKKE